MTMRSESRECVKAVPYVTQTDKNSRAIPWCPSLQLATEWPWSPLSPVSKAAFKAAAACDVTMTACSSSRLRPLRYWSVKDVLTSASKFPPLANRLHLQRYTCIVRIYIVLRRCWPFPAFIWGRAPGIGPKPSPSITILVYTRQQVKKWKGGRQSANIPM